MLLLPTMLLLAVVPAAADASTITRQTLVQEDPKNGPSSPTPCRIGRAGPFERVGRPIARSAARGSLAISRTWSGD